jgi:predicted choloylglycine hydrolase
MRRLTLAALFVTALLIVVIAIAPANAAEQGPPGILPIIYISGSEYEMGYQYGQQAASYINIVKDGLWSVLLEKYDRSFILDKLMRYDSYVKLELPKVNYTAILQGIADGARDAGYDVTYWDVLLINYQVEFEWLPLPSSCSNLAAWGKATAGSKVMVGSNFDYPFGRGYSYILMIVAYPKNGNAFVSFGIAGRLGDNFAMNDKGLIFMSNKGPNARPEDIGFGIADFILSPYIAMTCSTAEEAKDVILSLSLTNGINRLLVDKHGGAYVIEATASLKAVRKPGDFGEGDYMISTNHFLNSTMMPSQKPWDPKLYYPSSWFRYITAEKYIKDNYGKIDAETVMKIMSSTDYWNGTTWIKNAGWTGNTINRFGLSTATLHSVVAIPVDGVLYVCAGNPGYPQWGRLAPGQTGQYVKVEWKSSPLETTKALYGAAQRELFSTAQAIEKLSPSNDWSKILLNEKFDEVKAMYWEAIRKLAMAELEGNELEALKLYGEASTGFAKVQDLCKYLRSLSAFSTIESSLVDALKEINATITSINKAVATIETDLGKVKADVSLVKGWLPVTVDMTPVWIAVLLALIAAIAAITSVIQIRLKKTK